MLKIINVTKTYAGAPLLRGISLTINDGEIMCLLGSSGGGKTTLLRIIAGLEPADAGEIFFDDQNMRDAPIHQRGFGLMFQDLALFPHKNVFENVAFGLRMQSASRAEIRARVNEMLELVGLAGFAARDVNNLSGGEQQRVALARSLAPRPRLLMLDEPLGALDRILREQLVADLRAILKRIGTLRAALYVTHDQDEAFAIADRIAIIHAGRIAQIGAAAELYRAPASAFVARFLGMTNLFPARVCADGRVETELGTFVTASEAKQSPSELEIASAQSFDSASLRSGSHLAMTSALIRPDRVRVGASGVPARVEECTFRAGRYRARVVTDRGARLTIEIDRALAIDARVGLEIESVELLPA